MQKNKPEANHTKYEIRSALSEEVGLFYAMPPERDAELGCIEIRNHAEYVAPWKMH